MEIFYYKKHNYFQNLLSNYLTEKECSKHVNIMNTMIQVQVWMIQVQALVVLIIWEFHEVDH